MVRCKVSKILKFRDHSSHIWISHKPQDKVIQKVIFFPFHWKFQNPMELLYSNIHNIFGTIIIYSTFYYSESTSLSSHFCYIYCHLCYQDSFLSESCDCYMSYKPHFFFCSSALFPIEVTSIMESWMNVKIIPCHPRKQRGIVSMNFENEHSTSSVGFQE